MQPAEQTYLQCSPSYCVVHAASTPVQECHHVPSLMPARMPQCQYISQGACSGDRLFVTCVCCRVTTATLRWAVWLPTGRADVLSWRLLLHSKRSLPSLTLVHDVVASLWLNVCSTEQGWTITTLCILAQTTRKVLWFGPARCRAARHVREHSQNESDAVLVLALTVVWL